MAGFLRKKFPIIQADIPWQRSRSPEDKIMLGVLIEALKDYTKIYGFKRGLKLIETMKYERNRRIYNRRSAESYIFNDNKESENYIFGFKSICNYFAISLDRLRKKLREYMEKK